MKRWVITVELGSRFVAHADGRNQALQFGEASEMADKAGLFK